MGQDGRTFELSASRSIAAPADTVYNVFADYRDAHPRILPPDFFKGLTVLEGGYGAGTHIVVTGRFAGRTREIRGVVTEPEPGRLLVETYPDAGAVTWFRVVPDSDPAHCTVTLSSTFPRRAGILGWLEQRVVTRLLRRVYAEELDRVARYVAGAL